jgi:hypothetical protein
MAIGPIQMIVVGFDNDANFRGQIKRQLNEVHGRGVIRLLDILLAHKDKAGRFAVINERDIGDAEIESYDRAFRKILNFPEGFISSATSTDSREPSTGFTALDLKKIANSISPGTAVAIVLFEHKWAAGLSASVNEAGGHLLAQGFLTPDALTVFGEELEAIADAELAIESANAIKGAALIDALVFAAEAEDAKAQIRSQASNNTADKSLQSSIAAETLRQLIIAGVVDDTEIDTAISSLYDADLLDQEMVQQALLVAADAQKSVSEIMQAQITNI